MRQGNCPGLQDGSGGEQDSMAVIETFGLLPELWEYSGGGTPDLAVEDSGDTNYLFITWSRHA